VGLLPIDAHVLRDGTTNQTVPSESALDPQHGSITPLKIIELMIPVVVALNAVAEEVVIAARGSVSANLGSRVLVVL
jgi:hypothetical protein